MSKIKYIYSLMLISFLPCVVFAEIPLNMPRGVTPISREVYDLHMLILAIVTAIAIIVFGVLFWSIVHHRKSKGAVAAKFEHNTKAEIIWTLIPILILIAVGVPATKTLINMEDISEADLTIKVTGYQWKWKYDYVKEGVSFFSALDQASNEARQLKSNIDPNTVENYLLNVDKPMVLPIKKKIRILVTAADVIHAWWVPDFGWKRDAIPGFIKAGWIFIDEAGTYRGQCAELCGKDHAFMPIVVNAVSEEEYKAWIVDQKQMMADAMAGADREWTKDELMEKGKEVYGANCASCHMISGEGVKNLFPSLVNSSIVLGPVEEHIKTVLHGKNLMPAFAPQLNDADIAAVLVYERNSWGNNTGDIVQPADVKALR